MRSASVVFLNTMTSFEPGSASRGNAHHWRSLKIPHGGRFINFWTHFNPFLQHTLAAGARFLLVQLTSAISDITFHGTQPAMPRQVCREHLPRQSSVHCRFIRDIHRLRVFLPLCENAATLFRHHHFIGFQRRRSCRRPFKAATFGHFGDVMPLMRSTSRRTYAFTGSFNCAD